MDDFGEIEESDSLLTKTLGLALNTKIKFVAYSFIRIKLKTKKLGSIPIVQVIVCLAKNEILIFKDNLFKKY